MERIPNDHNDGYIEIDVREDGIYLTVTISSEFGKTVSVDDVVRSIEAQGVQDWSYTDVNETVLLGKQMGRAVKRISTNTTLAPVDEGITIEISQDKMRADIIFSPPFNGGKSITLDQIIDELKRVGVTSGVKAETLVGLQKDKQYGVSYEIAAGKLPVHGKDGYLQFHFDMSKKKPIPKLLDDGNVDFHQLNLIEIVRKGSTLVHCFQPVDGTDGYNVLGKPLLASKGKAVTLPKGKNVEVSPEGDSLIALIDGQVLYTDKSINVYPVYTVDGDVGSATGDIDFIGSVIVKGNIRTGYSVVASGDVEVHGVVEGAFIQCNGNIILHAGVQGGDKAILRAQGNLSTKFIQNSTVNVGGNISSASVMHSNVHCDGFLEVNGKTGLLVGGSVTVYDQVVANVIGSRMATATRVVVGIDPKTIERYNKLLKDLKEMKAQFESVDQARRRVPQENKTAIVQAVKALGFLKEQIVQIYKQLDELRPIIEKSQGTVTAFSHIQPGVHITIGNASIHIMNKVNKCTLYNKDGNVVIDDMSVRRG